MSDAPTPSKALKGAPPKGPEVVRDEPVVELGRWYWATKTEDGDFFGCLITLGSNYAELKNHWGSTIRIHEKDFAKKLRLEPNPEAVIMAAIERCKTEVRLKLAEIRKITQRLGLDVREKLEAPSQGGALSVLSGVDNVAAYKQELIQAKDKELPELFREVEKAHERMATWMKAQVLPMQALAGNMTDAVEVIEDRVFNISLYAGLVESVVQVADGEPASAAERLRVFQRLLYMDEECLVNYRHGGMEFSDIEDFDRWLKRKDNLARIFPFPRCMVAFRVRRNIKERDPAGSLSEAFIKVRLEESDKYTYLYIRNGRRLYRLATEIDFDQFLFPGRNETNLTEPMMVKMSCSRVESLVPRREFEALRRRHEEGRRQYEAWKKNNPKKDAYENPYREFSWHNPYSRHDWEPFDKTSVYYDEMCEAIEKRVKYYNRVAVIIQGLFDRSPVLHPHGSVKLWTPDGFAQAVELVYDGDALHQGPPPDFEAFRARCNATLGPGSITVGQEGFWEEVEAERENGRRARSWRYSSDRHELKRHRPYGNPGPGYIATVESWDAKRLKATYRWTRRRQWDTFWKRRGEPIPCVLRVPGERIFNVSAYKPGEYLQFYKDPRTRAQYLKWVNLLLAAEEFHAGNLKLGASSGDDA